MNEQDGTVGTYHEEPLVTIQRKLSWYFTQGHVKALQLDEREVTYLRELIEHDPRVSDVDMKIGDAKYEQDQLKIKLEREGVL